MLEDSKQSNPHNTWLQDSDTIAVVAATGLPADVVAPAVAAYYYLLSAFRLTDGWEDEGARLREKYPELLRNSVIDKRFISYELESVMIQLETSLPASTVVTIMAALMTHLGNDVASYRQWAKGWV